jgi:hypothetical protein
MSEQTSTVFGTTAATPQGTSGSGVQDDPVALLVGEGKKFKTVQDLAKGKLESDSFIAQLTQENKALREAALNGGDTSAIEAKIAELLAGQKGNGQTTNQTSNQPQSEPLTAEKVLDLLDRREKEKQLKNNADYFNQTIAQTLGEKASDAVMQRLNDLGLDLQTFNHIVATNPQSALKLVGIKPNPTAPTGNIAAKGASANTAAVFSAESNGNTKQNFAYFEKLRKELGARYYTPEIQGQLIKARKELGADFFTK